MIFLGGLLGVLCAGYVPGYGGGMEADGEVEEGELERPLPKAVAGPVFLWLLAALWMGLGIWGLTEGVTLAVVLVLGSPLCVVLAVGWRSADNRAWERYRAQEERKVNLYE